MIILPIDSTTAQQQQQQQQPTSNDTSIDNGTATATSETFTEDDAVIVKVTAVGALCFALFTLFATGTLGCQMLLSLFQRRYTLARFLFGLCTNPPRVSKEL
jgi:non-ribosomal peptide synthetase component E (peptide arylation enzyme)